MRVKFMVISSAGLPSGAGIVIANIWDNLAWLGWVLIGIGIIALILYFTWNSLAKRKYMPDKFKQEVYPSDYVYIDLRKIKLQ